MGGLSKLGFHYLQFKGIWGFETLSPKPRIEGVGVMEGHARTQWLIKTRMGNLVQGRGLCRPALGCFGCVWCLGFLGCLGCLDVEELIRVSGVGFRLYPKPYNP